MQGLSSNDSLTALTGQYLTPETLKASASTMSDTDMSYVWRTWVAQGIPKLFEHNPLQFEELRKWLADQLSVSPLEIGLVGSARVGFSLAPKKYGTVLGNHSDLDLLVVSSQVFSVARNDSERWLQDVRNAVIPSTGRYVMANFETISNNLRDGFLQPHMLDSRYDSQKLKRIAWRLGLKLSNTPGVVTSKVKSIRIYKGWIEAERQWRRNYRLLRQHLVKG